ncbi:MAG: serine hydrolase [Bacilli bacterium]|nr:serine hydrolase [Bacilli bacterium]
MIDEIMKRIDEFGLSIDSLYIQSKDSLNVIINSDKLHELRSCSKLLVAMAMGIAIENNLFSLEENIYNYIEEYITNDNNREKIRKWTIRTLLTHTTGYDKMLMSNKEIVDKNLDKSKLLEYALNYDIANEPNATYTYNNVEPFIISVLFKEKHNIDLDDYIKINIFDKIEINNYSWEKYGEYCPGCTGLYLLPKDFHKLGMLILNDGVYNNVSIVPSNWIREMIKMQIETPYLVKTERLFPKYGAGYFTFISRDGYIFRDGTNGQYIIINKEKGLVICIMSSEKDMSKITEIFRGIL